MGKVWKDFGYNLFKGWILNQEVALKSPWSFFKMQMPLLPPCRPPGPPGARALAGVVSAGPQVTHAYTRPLSPQSGLKADGRITWRANWFLLPMPGVWQRGWAKILHFWQAPRRCPRRSTQNTLSALLRRAECDVQFKLGAHTVCTFHEKDKWNCVLTWDWFHLFLCTVFIGCL